MRDKEKHMKYVRINRLSRTVYILLCPISYHYTTYILSGPWDLLNQILELHSNSSKPEENNKKARNVSIIRGIYYICICVYERASFSSILPIGS